MHIKQPLIIWSHAVSLLGSLPSSVQGMDTANSDIPHCIFCSLRNVALNLQKHNSCTSSVIIAMIFNCFLIVYLQSIQTAVTSILWEKAKRDITLDVAIISRQPTWNTQDHFSKHLV